MSKEEQTFQYVKLFNHPALDDPFNHALEQRLFDNIPDVIYVSHKYEIKTNLSIINDFRSLQDLNDFLKTREGKLPLWTKRYKRDLRQFQRKMYAINDYLYDVGGMGSLRFVSAAYYKYTGRDIKEFAVPDPMQEILNPNLES